MKAIAWYLSYALAGFAVIAVLLPRVALGMVVFILALYWVSFWTEKRRHPATSNFPKTKQ